MNIESILSQYDRITNQVNLLHQHIESLPSGLLRHKKCGNCIKWYKKENGQTSYLKKDQQALIDSLILKDYYLLLLHNLLTEKKSLELYHNHYKLHSIPNQELLRKTACYEKFISRLLQHPAYLPFISSHFQFSNNEILQWATAPYQAYEKFPDQRIHKSISGHSLRSKSEALIDMALYYHKIPFRYECALELGDTTFFPDFTMCHPKSGKIVYWEHFGMMEIPSYRKQVIKKLDIYTENGYIPTIDLITTYETKEHPLTPDSIDHIIRQYFL